MTELLEITSGNAGSLHMSTGEGDGRTTLFLTDPSGTTVRRRSCSFDEYEQLMSTLQQEGEPGVSRFFEGAEVTTLAGVKRKALMLSAEQCVDAEGFVSEEKVREFAAEHGMTYTEARATVGAALSGDTGSTEDEPTLVARHAESRGLSFADAASELAAAGSVEASDRPSPERGRSTEPKLDHAEIQARAERDGTTYADAARAMAYEKGNR